MNNLVYNGIKCLVCEEEIASFHRHDYKHCSCGNAMIDGGLEYERYGWRDDKNTIEKISLYDNSPFQEIREKFTWGRNFDKDMNRLPKVEWIKLKDITDDHLQGIIDYLIGKEEEKYIKLFLEEKLYRNEE